VLVNQGRALVDYFIELARLCGDAKLASNWVQQDVLRTLKERNCEITQFPLTAADLGALLAALKSGELPSSRGREVFAQMLTAGQDVAEAMQAMGIEQVDESALVDLCRSLLAANERVVADVQSGNDKAVGSLIGQAKKQNSNVDPQRVREICLELIAAM